MEITKHLFLNFSILIILLFFYLICSDKYKKILTSKPVTILLFICLLWVCVQFSYNPIPFSRYDLRIIPLVIGGLYLGIGPILVLALLIIRSFFGWDMGLAETSLLYGPLAIVFWFMAPWFWKQSSSRRILIAVLMGMGLSVLTIGGMGLFHPYTNWVDAWFAYLVIPPLGIGIVSYSLEFIKNNNQMRLQLIKTEKLKAVEQMGAAISHEIRNPLTTATGFVQLLQDDYLPRHKRREYLALVKDELHSAERVIQDYLTFAKPSLEVFEELNVKSEMKQIIKILQPLANQNSVEINTDFSVIGFIKGDQQIFRQCFINVIKNAIESMPTGGYLSLKTEYDHNYVMVTVKDTGVGMTKEQIDRLGEPFYSTKGKNGTGLGMMVVYSIVRAMNGWIRVESEVDAGTTFHFHFPSIRPMRNYMKAENQ
ncbi:histidine kinase [Bacillus sp. MUM 116]|uniref:sensor histidine kinase n=1 Tax=Bacillus sp. MUM 116 TaxID=1678002 RepID=UPI0008F575BE|nr:HAMP domain-containing sensor histidine kinase [Bacillus sp. MUM 116]OIK09738.1 histidine kinase [Bacillus sp. MUM 116]